MAPSRWLVCALHDRCVTQYPRSDRPQRFAGQRVLMVVADRPRGGIIRRSHRCASSDQRKSQAGWHGRRRPLGGVKHDRGRHKGVASRHDDEGCVKGGGVPIRRSAARGARCVNSASARLRRFLTCRQRDSIKRCSEHRSGVAQLAEQGIHKPWVVGSSPTAASSTTFSQQGLATCAGPFLLATACLLMETSCLPGCHGS